MAVFLFQRHPRFTLFTIVGALITFLLFFYPSDGDRVFNPMGFQKSHGPIRTISARLRQAEAIYKKSLIGRKGLIEKFGGLEQVELFPPNEPPFPPYTVWDFFPATFNCPHELERVGSLGDGGKWVCGLSRIAEKRGCVIYSFGIHSESSFEAELLARTKCQVWGYDFNAGKFGPEITSSLSSRAHFHPFGLGEPSDEDDAFGNDHHDPSSPDAHKPKLYTLQTLMASNNHEFIDILKIDIEGFEFATLAHLLEHHRKKRKPLPFGQLQIQLHTWNTDFKTFLMWFEMLETMGLRPFWTEPSAVYSNYNKNQPPHLAEYSFINVLGTHELVTDV